MKFFAVALALASVSVFAATSGNLNLKGKVPEMLSILVSPEAIALTLPLDITQTDTLVASVNEKSNSASGYKVNISSANQGKLVHTNGTDDFAYSLKYDGTILDLANGEEQVHALPLAVDVDKLVQISYTGVPSEEMVAGNYRDTITFTISAN
jgi:hypothetical protein